MHHFDSKKLNNILGRGYWEKKFLPGLTLIDPQSKTLGLATDQGARGETA